MRAREQRPRAASGQRISGRWVKKCRQAGMSLLEGLLMPKRLFIWTLAMVAAAPMVNPVMTGMEMKRTSTPRLSRPRAQMMQPTRNELKGAKSALCRA